MSSKSSSACACIARFPAISRSWTGAPAWRRHRASSSLDVPRSDEAGVVSSFGFVLSFGPAIFLVSGMRLRLCEGSLDRSFKCYALWPRRAAAFVSTWLCCPWQKLRQVGEVYRRSAAALWAATIGQLAAVS
jgi:hypothetical protein